MISLEKIWNVLNKKDVCSFFKKDYYLKYYGIDDSTVEVKRFDKKTRKEIPYNPRLLLGCNISGSYECSG